MAANGQVKVVTRGIRQGREILANRLAGEGIPVVVQVGTVPGGHDLKVLVGDSATRHEFDRVDEVAVQFQCDFGLTVMVAQ
jgi:hypothetical protein